MLYIVRNFVSDLEFYCLFEVERVDDFQYVIKRVIEDNSNGELYFYRDEADQLYWMWKDEKEKSGSSTFTSMKDPQYIYDPNGVYRDTADVAEFNTDEEALLWFKLNY